MSLQGSGQAHCRVDACHNGSNDEYVSCIRHTLIGTEGISTGTYLPSTSRALVSDSFTWAGGYDVLADLPQLGQHGRHLPRPELHIV